MASSTPYQNKLTNLLEKAKDLVSLLTPITLCMCIVVCSVGDFELNKQEELKKNDFLQSSMPSAVPALERTLYNVLYYIGFLILIGVLGVGCCKLRWYKFIFGCLAILTAFVLLIAVREYAIAFCFMWNKSLDFLTMALITWNFVMTGLLAMFWLSPVQLKQSYLIILAAELALLIVNYLPFWTNWALLIVLSIWDIIAVLWKHGPVHILLKGILEFKSELNIPVLIYSTNGMEITDCTNERRIECSNDNMGITLEAIQEPAHCNMPFDSFYADHDFCSDSDYLATNDTSLQIYSEIRLGLADFIFYSVLIAQTQLSCSWTTTIACFIAILIGLSFTFFLLFKFQKDLPALPLSIALGILFTVSTSTLLSPLMDILALKQIFI